MYNESAYVIFLIVNASGVLNFKNIPIKVSLTKIVYTQIKWYTNRFFFFFPELCFLRQSFAEYSRYKHKNTSEWLFLFWLYSKLFQINAI